MIASFAACISVLGSGRTTEAVATVVAEATAAAAVGGAVAALEEEGADISSSRSFRTLWYEKTHAFDFLFAFTLQPFPFSQIL